MGFWAQVEESNECGCCGGETGGGRCSATKKEGQTRQKSAQPEDGTRCQSGHRTLFLSKPRGHHAPAHHHTLTEPKTQRTKKEKENQRQRPKVARFQKALPEQHHEKHPVRLPRHEPPGQPHEPDFWTRITAPAHSSDARCKQPAAAVQPGKPAVAERVGSERDWNFGAVAIDRHGEFGCAGRTEFVFAGGSDVAELAAYG